MFGGYQKRGRRGIRSECPTAKDQTVVQKIKSCERDAMGRREKKSLGGNGGGAQFLSVRKRREINSEAILRADSRTVRSAVVVKGDLKGVIGDAMLDRDGVPEGEQWGERPKRKDGV